MKSNPNGNPVENAKSWILRFIKFNIIGFIVFLIGTAIYAALFGTFGAWSWGRRQRRRRSDAVLPNQLLEHEKERKNVQLKPFRADEINRLWKF